MDWAPSTRIGDSEWDSTFFFFNILNTTAERMRESDGGRNVWEGVMEAVCEEREDGAAEWEGDARVLVF